MKNSIVNIKSTLVFCVLLQSCSSSSGVVKTGPDTYMISRSEKGFRGNSGAVKAAALAEAENWCQKRGKVMRVISASQKDMVPMTSDASAEIHFKALEPNNPEATESTDTGDLKNRVFRGNENIQTYSIEGNSKKVEPVKNDRYAEILKLGELKEKGLITAEEFETEKKRILKTVGK